MRVPSLVLAQCEASAPSIARPDRILELDGIRGIAVIAVLVAHFCAPLAPISRARQILELGTYGVDLFFLLSGYLITGILLKSREDTAYFRRFYARRAFRIFPIYYAYLAIYCAIYGSTGLHISKAWYFFYLSNWRPVTLQPILLLHFWSLAVEEQYYLAWPAIVRYTSRAALVSICTGLVILSPVALAVGQSYHLHPSVLHRGTIFHLAPIAIGSLLSAMQIKAPPLSWLRVGWIRHWGKYSYGAYVWHPFVLAFIVGRVLRHAPVGWTRLILSAVIGIPSAYALARLSWALIEGPMASVKERFTARS